MQKFKSIEICAGAGGQALGLEKAGFEHIALVEIEALACKTLKLNRPEWNVIHGDIKDFKPSLFSGEVDLLAGGVPCPPFSVAGKQLGKSDERDLFPEALRLIKECNPKAVLIENVRGLLDSKFEKYRNEIINQLKALGYNYHWKLVNSSDFGLPQLRPRSILVALKPQYYKHFMWPKKILTKTTVGELLYDEMSLMGWENAKKWREKANKIAPTLVGGSKKHGGADLGPTRAKQAWETIGIDGKGIADLPPINGFSGNPRLTLKMTAMLQGFPGDWIFEGKKTPVYRQIGNAFPPPVAEAIGKSIFEALKNEKS
jgi:DNA (cytosine-5)-methyltransferase 1